MIKKIIGSCLLLVLILAVAGVLWIRGVVKDEVGEVSFVAVKEYVVAKFRRDLTEEEKFRIKEAVNDAKYKVYEEATEYNPEGDLLPDELDDTVKEKIKEQINEN